MKMKRVITPLLFVGLAFTITLKAQSNKNAITAVAVGRTAPDFTLKDVNGQSYSLNNFRGRITVVAFISTQCPISNEYNERMRSIAQDYGTEKVAFLGINSNFTESRAEIKAHAGKNNLIFPILKDESNKVADAFGAQRTPEIFVIDAEGTVRYHGRIDDSRDLRRVKRQDLREALNELRAGKTPTLSEGKAFGCLIKRVQNKKEVKASEIKAKNFEPKIGRIKPADYNKYKDTAKGKVLVVNFWATYCGPCVVEFPEFVMIDQKYRDKGVKIVAISADEIADIKPKVIPFIKEQNARFEVLVQETDDPQEMIDVVDKNWQGVLPATYVYDKQGNKILTRYGIIDREQLVGAIEKALKQ
jgi:peroxiredoxin